MVKFTSKQIVALACSTLATLLAFTSLVPILSGGADAGGLFQDCEQDECVKQVVLVRVLAAMACTLCLLSTLIYVFVIGYGFKCVMRVGCLLFLLATAMGLFATAYMSNVSLSSPNAFVIYCGGVSTGLMAIATCLTFNDLLATETSHLDEKQLRAVQDVSHDQIVV